MLRSVVGAGGKTSYMKQVAKEYVEKGLTVFVTTSTKMYVEEDTILSGNKDEILAHLEEKRYAMAGISVSDMRAEERADGQINRKYTDDRGEGEKFKSLPLDTFRSICTHADVVLVEADGSKHLPLKYPNESEPVLYEETDEIVLSAVFALEEKTVQEIRDKMQDLLNRRKASQPLDLPSAGSAFKRPVGAYAAALIDEAGLKGYAVGDAAISQKHAGFAVNLGNATAAQMRQLLQEVSDIVFEKSGFRLEPEVRIW